MQTKHYSYWKSSSYKTLQKKYWCRISLHARTMMNIPTYFTKNFRRACSNVNRKLFFPESVFLLKIPPVTIQCVSGNKYAHGSEGDIYMLDNVSKYASNETGYINAEYYFYYAALIRPLIELTLVIGAGILLKF